MRDLIRQESGLFGIERRAARAARWPKYQLWRADDGTFETYQRIQRRNVFAVGDQLCLSNPTAHDLDVSDMNFYDLHYDGGLADNAGHLIVD
jgi:hypothetical protein